MAWRYDLPKCPVSPEDRGEFMKPKTDPLDDSRNPNHGRIGGLRSKEVSPNVSTTAQCGAGEAIRTLHRLPDGVVCKCPNMQTGPDGGHWCCTPPAPVRAAQEDAVRQALAAEIEGAIHITITKRNEKGVVVSETIMVPHRNLIVTGLRAAPQDNPQQKEEG